LLFSNLFNIEILTGFIYHNTTENEYISREKFLVKKTLVLFTFTELFEI